MTPSHAIRILLATAALAVAAPVSPARAGGIAALSGPDREHFCMLVAESHQDSWAPHEASFSFAQVDDVLFRLDTAICLAHFEDALDVAREGRPLLTALPHTWRGNVRRARLEVLEGTAQVALGSDDVARAHFRQALEIDPHLELDSETSPKVRRVFEDARAASLARR